MIGTITQVCENDIKKRCLRTKLKSVVMSAADLLQKCFRVDHGNGVRSTGDGTGPER